MSTPIDLVELRKLVDEYIETCDDDDERRNERFSTPRGYASDELEDFMYWLKHRADQPEGDEHGI